jgi:hypothetical protein
MLTSAIGVTIEQSVTLDRAGRPFSLDPRGSLANLLAEQGLFMLSRASFDSRADARGSG